ncbi:adenylate/guanylate cyclase domain-containing protein [Neosynechococcus sphagnicola]|uniref:adenylate/guanylate cyclase domain-containing protein n=1 Tax=Neosynechococcus sphagnicola TaxID=1501145 RepID=UPI00308444A1
MPCCSIWKRGNFYLIDLGSRNGSFINGRRVSIPVILHNGDHLTFGQSELEFCCPSHAPVATDNSGSKEYTATAALHVRSLISVLVVDIRNFTVLARQMDEKILSELIGTWFRRAGDIIREHGSWVDKYIGDAVMAVWIHGTQGVGHREMLQILQALQSFHHMTSELCNLYPVPFQLRVGAGINTGYAMVGNTGSGDRPDYTALGDTVNEAFRLETITKQISLDFALGETTYRLLSKLLGHHNIFQQHQVSLKGYESPMLTYAGSFEDLSSFIVNMLEFPCASEWVELSQLENLGTAKETETYYS